MTWPLVDALHAQLQDIAADLSCRAWSGRAGRTS